MTPSGMRCRVLVAMGWASLNCADANMTDAGFDFGEPEYGAIANQWLIDRDKRVYGCAYVDANGKRVDPQTVKTMQRERPG